MTKDRKTGLGKPKIRYANNELNSGGAVFGTGGKTFQKRLNSQELPHWENHRDKFKPIKQEISPEEEFLMLRKRSKEIQNELKSINERMDILEKEINNVIED